MLPRCLLAISLAVAAATTRASADRWESPGGFLTVEEPEAPRYRLAEPQSPPEIAKWEATEGSMTFTVDLIPQFPGAQPTEETVARAYAQPGTEVNQLPTRETGGHEVWTIKTSNADLKQLIAIVYHAGWVHRIKAAGLAADFETDEAQDFVDSVRIQPEDWEPPRDRIEINGDVWVYRDAEWAREVSPFSDDDSWIALAAAVGVALIAILYFILRRRSRPDVI